MRARDVAAIIRGLTAADLEVWVEGGWGVDALVGAPSRPHKDVDLVLRPGDAAAAVGWLEAQGFRQVAGEAPSGLWRDGDGRGVDLRVVDLDAHPAEWWTGTGTIGGLTVRCLTAEAQMALHAGYEPSDKDRHDVRLLHEVFGLSAPAEYRDGR